ncbi:MAG: 3-isopropylmalate dehydratase small subunit [Armatimonadota bacterium]
MLKGRAWKFGHNISTDHIAPGRLIHLRSNLPELTKHVMEDAREGFYEMIEEGDFVVAGENFGQGSSREHAPTIIKMAGIAAVLAKDFARIFYRNCVNIGLPPIKCDTDPIEEGDELEVDLAAGKVYDRTKDLEIEFAPLPPVMARILSDGGLVEHIKKHGRLAVD